MVYTQINAIVNTNFASFLHTRLLVVLRGTVGPVAYSLLAKTSYICKFINVIMGAIILEHVSGCVDPCLPGRYRPVSAWAVSTRVYLGCIDPCLPWLCRPVSAWAVSIRVCLGCVDPCLPGLCRSASAWAVSTRVCLGCVDPCLPGLCRSASAWAVWQQNSTHILIVGDLNNTVSVITLFSCS